MGAIKSKLNSPLDYLPHYNVAFLTMNTHHFIHFNKVLRLNKSFPTLPNIIGLRCKPVLDPCNITVSSKLKMPFFNLYHLKSSDIFFGYLFVVLPANIFTMDSYFLIKSNTTFYSEQQYNDVEVKYQSEYVSVLASEKGAVLVTLTNNNCIYPKVMLHGERKEK